MTCFVMVIIGGNNDHGRRELEGYDVETSEPRPSLFPILSKSRELCMWGEGTIRSLGNKPNRQQKTSGFHGHVGTEAGTAQFIAPVGSVSQYSGKSVLS
jgi:hypothetical protein